MLLPKGNHMAQSQVVARSCDTNGNVMGRSHINPKLDTRMYQVEFTGGKVTELITNVIAESMYTHCDSEGNEYLLLDALVDYHKDNWAISLSDQQIIVWGRPVTSKTTVGWKICCNWKNGCSSWERLSKLKGSHLLQTAEFAITRN